MDKLIFHAVSGVLGLFLAIRFIPGVSFVGTIRELLIAGVFLGLINFFIKPVVKLISLPIRIITLGLFSLLINVVFVWITIDIFFAREFIVEGIIPLLLTTLVVWLLNLFFGLHNSKK